jgi:hypothetical protein
LTRRFAVATPARPARRRPSGRLYITFAVLRSRAAWRSPWTTDEITLGCPRGPGLWGLGPRSAGAAAGWSASRPRVAAFSAMAIVRARPRLSAPR